MKHRLTPKTLALQKIIELGNRQIAAGKVTPAAEAIRQIRNHRVRVTIKPPPHSS